MADEITKVEPFLIDVSWPDREPNTEHPLLDASLGGFSLSVREKILTTNKSDKGDTGTRLSIPLYDLAEWIATNWWALLFEPRKSDESESDPEYQSRHWLGYLRSGFAFPDIWLIPAGDQMEIAAKETYLRHSRLNFTESLVTSVSLDTVRLELSKFVQQVLDRLSSKGINETLAHEAWELINSATLEDQQYCRLIGSLGLSPYDYDKVVDDILDSVWSRQVEYSILTDMCEAAPAEYLVGVASLTRDLQAILQNAPKANIRPLTELDVPPDNYEHLAGRWGVEAAHHFRFKFGLNAREPLATRELLKKIDLDPEGKAVTAPESSINVAQVSAGLEVNDHNLRLVLAEGSPQHRRFTAARAAFLSWVGKGNSSRLVTGAKTRQQQASRSFAAELLAPVQFLKMRAGEGPISAYRIQELADELDVSPRVVGYQARYAKIALAEPTTGRLN